MTLEDLIKRQEVTAICAIKVGATERANALPPLTTTTLSEAEMADDSHSIIEWRPVVGFPGYEVSNAGQVRSLRRQFYRHGYPVQLQSRTLTPVIKRSRYGRPVAAIVSVSIDGAKTDLRVHRLVLEAFVGPCPADQEGCHEDGDPANNRLGNLRWGTRQSNRDDMVRHGTRVRPPMHVGDAHPRAALNAERAAIILSVKKWRRGMQTDFATEFGVSTHAIYCVRKGKTWRHVR